MEQMDLIKMTPDAKKAAQAAAAAAAASKNKNNKNTDYNDKENNSSMNKSGLLDDEVNFHIKKTRLKRLAVP
jgi:hypothetical protein